MATHSSVLAWRIPGTGEPGGLPSLGSHRIGHDGSDLTAAAAGKCKCDHHNQQLNSVQFSSVQSLSHIRLFATPCTVARQGSLSNTNSRSLLKLMSIESVMPSNHFLLCRLLLLLSSIFPSIRVFSNESALHIRQPKYWSFSFNISPSNEHPGQISFRMDLLDLLAALGTLKSLLQHHSSRGSILFLYSPSAFFIVQLSHPNLFHRKITNHLLLHRLTYQNLHPPQQQTPDCGFLHSFSAESIHSHQQYHIHCLIFPLHYFYASSFLLQPLMKV